MSPSRRSGRGLLSSFTVLLLTFLLIGFPALAFAAASSSSASVPASHSQPADSDLICHTSDPDECYPRIFQPTDEFQTVHEDQELPPGLHVRLNIYTGHKEAKINDPTEGNDPSLDGLPVDQGIVLVDSQPQEEVPAIPKGAPAYDNAGAVKEPPHEARYFYEALASLKSGVVDDEAAFKSALEDLQELAHDIYYGVKVTEDTEAVKSLLCLLADQGASTDGTPSRTSEAASILAGALSNNPTALKAVADKWSDFMGSKCPQRDETLGDVFYSKIGSSSADTAAQAGKIVKAKVGAINGLIKDEAIRADFLKKGGMKQLLEVLTGPSDSADKKAWEAAQRKVGQLALDNFLDEDMGATLGQWPTVAKSSSSNCQTSEAGQQEEGCWDHHVERIMKENSRDKSHWSKDLHDRLAKVRKTQGKSGGHGEL